MTIQRLHIIFITYVMLALLICSCSDIVDLANCCDDTKTATISLNITPSDIETIETKATASDYNIYIYNSSLDLMTYIYSTSGSEKVYIPEGVYNTYVIYGMGKEIGELTESQILDYNYSSTSQTTLEACNVMTGSLLNKSVTSTTTTLDITVTRIVAKLELNLSASSSFASSIDFEYVELVNANTSMDIFDSSCKATSSTITTYSQTSFTTSLAKTFYVLENCQGTKSTITSQANKSSSNAPSSYCTYFHIRGNSNGAKVDYYIYAGANNTSDFNVTRNNHYIINSTISGINDIDTRVSVTSASITSFAKSSYDDLDEDATATLSLKSVRQGNPIYLKYSLIEGNGKLSIDGTSLNAGSIKTLTTTDVEKDYALSFDQLQDGDVTLGITVYDNDGFSYYKEISTTYESTKELVVGISPTSLSLETNESGSVTLSISEENYSDNFTVKYELVGSLTTTCKYGTSTISSGSSVSVSSGSSTFTLSSSTTGSRTIKFTVSDTKGQSVEKTVTMTVTQKTAEQKSLKMTVQGKNYCDYSYSSAGYYIKSGTYPQVKFTITSETALPCDITLTTLRASYYYVTATTFFQMINVTNNTTLSNSSYTMSAGSTTATFTVSDVSGYGTLGKVDIYSTSNNTNPVLADSYFVASDQSTSSYSLFSPSSSEISIYLNSWFDLNAGTFSTITSSDDSYEFYIE